VGAATRSTAEPAGRDVAASDSAPAPGGLLTEGVPRVTRRAASGILGAVIVLWGFNWPVMKVGLQYVPPFQFAALRSVVALVGAAFLVGILGQLRLPDRRDIPIILSTGLLQVGAVLVLIIVALQFVPAGRASILIYTTPLWVTPLAALFLHERLTRLRLAGLVVGMAGVAVLFNPLGFDWSDPDVVLGNALLLLGALAWAVTIVHVRGHTWRGTPLQLLPWQLGVATCLTVPLALMSGTGQGIDWVSPLPAIVLYTGLIATAFCNWGMITANRALPATTTALLSLGVPVCGVLFSALMLGEALNLTTIVGLALIGAGLVAVGLGERRQPGTGAIQPAGLEPGAA
jgi:drug/metabolite transporter (DMT)-like permease